MEKVVESIAPATEALPAETAQQAAGESGSTYSLFVVGGLDSNFEPVNTAWRYSTEKGEWEELPSIASPRAGPIAVLAEGCLYMLGGEFCGDALKDAQRYDPASGKWAAMAPMLEGRIRGAAVAAGGYIYVMGGQDGLKPVNTAERYDIKTDTWTALPPMSRQRYCGAAAVAPEGSILVFGGDLTDEGTAASTERFDPKTEVWDFLPSVRTPPCGSTVAVTADGDMAFAFGGLGLSGQALPVAEQLPLGPALAAAGAGPDAAANFVAPAWAPMPQMLIARHLASVTGYGKGAAVVGGKGPAFEAISNVELYDAEAGTWEELPALPNPRLRAAVVAGLL